MGLYGYPGLPPGYPPPHGMHGAPVPGMPPNAVPTSGFSAPDARRSRSRTAGDCLVSFKEIAEGHGRQELQFWKERPQEEER